MLFLFLLPSDQASGGVENLMPDHGQTTAKRCEGEVRGQECVESVHGQPNVQSSERGGVHSVRSPHDSQETAQRSEASGSALLPSGQEDARQLPKKARGVNSPKFAKGQKLKRRAPGRIAAR